jgi:peptidoglycan/LPS O-acetylase OafA/YrhL
MIEFLYGVLAAEILLRLPTVRDTFYQRMLPVCLICIGAIGLLCTILIPDAFSMRFLYYGIPALLIVFGTAMLGSAPCARQLVYLGDASYSIYLAHLFDQVLPDVFILPATMITIILSSFTYFFFERPLTRALTKKKTPSMLVVA